MSEATFCSLGVLGLGRVALRNISEAVKLGSFVIILRTINRRERRKPHRWSGAILCPRSNTNKPFVREQKVAELLLDWGRAVYLLIDSSIKANFSFAMLPIILRVRLCVVHCRYRLRANI